MNPTIQKILVYNSLVMDTINRTGEHRIDVSGKGINVSRVLAQLGKDCCHLTQLGGVLRPFFLDLCEKDGLRVEWVESSSPIRFCYTILERDKKIVTELVEESERVGGGDRGQASRIVFRPCKGLFRGNYFRGKSRWFRGQPDSGNGPACPG
jgi:fructose-1-phosphate kinase PfkB-like protein